MTSVDYKYTGELNALRGILGHEEDLNNYGRWITHEGDSTITRGDAMRGHESRTLP